MPTACLGRDSHAGDAVLDDDPRVRQLLLRAVLRELLDHVHERLGLQPTHSASQQVNFVLGCPGLSE